MENKNPQHKYFKTCETLALMQDVLVVVYANCDMYSPVYMGS